MEPFSCRPVGPFGTAYSMSKTSPMAGIIVKATKEISVYA